MLNQKVAVFAGAISLLILGNAFAIGVPEPNVPNLNNDEIVDFGDFAILSGNWLKSGAGLQGDLDDNGTVDTDDLMVFSWYWLAEYSEYQQCQTADIDNDGIIDFEDMSMLAQNWLETGVGFSGDFDDSNSVDYDDLYILAECWLKGTRPIGIWEQFKAALSEGDVNKALTFIAEVSRDRYAEIFQIIEPSLSDYAAGLGDLILERQREDKIIYEMPYQDGPQTLLFPVIFIRDNDSSWRIFNF